MAVVRIKVYGADGKYHGGVLKYGPHYKNQWVGARKPGIREVMLCAGDIKDGEWFLLELVEPRQITGSAECDDFYDGSSHCCRRTPVQALHWFQQQAIGAPPALIELVRAFTNAWSLFVASEPAMTLLAAVCSRCSVGADDALFSGQEGRSAFELLRSLRLLSEGFIGGEVSYRVNSIVEELEVSGFIAWMNEHIRRLGPMPSDSALPMVASAATPVHAQTRQPVARESRSESAGAPNPRPEDVNQLLRDGRTWRIRYAGKERPLPDRVGLKYLQILLACPNQAVGVWDLKGIVPVSVAASVQPSLDAAAHAAAKTEYEEAVHQLEEAQRNADLGQIGAARKRLARLVDSVGVPTSRSATRQLPSDLDRVRAGVGQAIAAALREILAVHPEAHQHLEQSLVTPSGITPCYRPSVPTRWLVNLASGTGAISDAADPSTT
jgi:hypothetical protein